MPVRLAASRVAPAIAVTTPTARFCLLQHRSLLDVQFDIAEQLAAGARGSTDVFWIEPEFLQRLAHRDAGAVMHVQHAFIERARNRTAAQQRGRKAHTLLVGKAGDLDRERQPLAAPMQIGHAGNRRDHAERAVPFAGIAHGIVMRAQHQAWCTRTLALVTAADIADRVEMRAHAGLTHPGQQQVGCRAVLVSEKNPRQMFRRFGNFCQFVDAANDEIAEFCAFGSCAGADVRLAH